MEKQLTTQQYATRRGITEGAVRKAIKMGHKLDGVLRVEKFGKAHVFYVSSGYRFAKKKSLKKVA